MKFGFKQRVRHLEVTGFIGEGGKWFFGYSKVVEREPFFTQENGFPQTLVVDDGIEQTPTAEEIIANGEFGAE